MTSNLPANLVAFLDEIRNLVPSGIGNCPWCKRPTELYRVEDTCVCRRCVEDSAGDDCHGDTPGDRS